MMEKIENYKHSNITELILKAYFTVYNKLGYGFLEKVYENAMLIELDRNNLIFEKQKSIKVYYDNFVVGDYFADIMVENCVIVELKAVSNLCPEHEVQLVNYLKATGVEVGLLLNFGIQPEYKRRVLTKEYLSGKKIKS